MNYKITMQDIGFIGCIPKQFEKDYIEHNLQFLEHIFPKFSEEEKVDFISVIHAHFDEETTYWVSSLDLNKNNKEYYDHVRKIIDDETKKRDAILDRLGARHIVPEKITFNYV